MSALREAIRRIVADLTALDRRFALIGELSRLLEEVLDGTATGTGSPDDKAEAPSPMKPRPKRAQKRRRSS